MPHAGLYKGVSAVGLITSTQGPNIGSTAMSLTTASESVTASQVQGAPQPQGPLPTAVHIPSTAIDTKFNASISLSAFKYMGSHTAPASAKPTKNLIDTDASQSDVSLQPTRNGVLVIAVPAISGELLTQGSRSQTVQLLSKATRSSGTTWLPPISAGEIAASSIQIPSLEKNTPFPTLGTPTITANPESQNIFTSGPTLSRDSALTLGSDTSTTIPAPQTSITQLLKASDSLSSLTTTMGYLSKDRPFLTISGQTVTVNSLEHYSIDSQLLTKSGVITLSRTTISLAPNESAIIVGTSTEAFGPSATARFGSGSNGTEVQRFSGNALGARDGLWGSSMMFLVFFMVLLWL